MTSFCISRTTTQFSSSKFGIVQAACREALKELFPAEGDGQPPFEAPSTPKTMLTPMKSLENSTQSSHREDLRKSAHGRSVSTPFSHNPVSLILQLKTFQPNLTCSLPVHHRSSELSCSSESSGNSSTAGCDKRETQSCRVGEHFAWLAGPKAESGAA